MNKKEYIMRFTSFLLENDALEDFQREMRETRNLSLKQYFDDYIDHPKNFLFWAFPWQGTAQPDREQQNYWKILDRKWWKYLDLID